MSKTQQPLTLAHCYPKSSLFTAINYTHFHLSIHTHPHRHEKQLIFPRLSIIIETRICNLHKLYQYIRQPDNESMRLILYGVGMIGFQLFELVIVLQLRASLCVCVRECACVNGCMCVFVFELFVDFGHWALLLLCLSPEQDGSNERIWLNYE